MDIQNENQQSSAEVHSSSDGLATADKSNEIQFAYATFWQRFGALLIDVILLAVLNFLLRYVGVVGAFGSFSAFLLPAFVNFAYYVSMTSATGATLGKQFMNIRVQTIDTGENIDFLTAVIREVLGKMLSGLILCIGYFWMIWDSQKQTWHDKIAGTVVVKDN